MIRDRCLDWDAHRDNEHGHIDRDTSSSDDDANVTEYVPISSGFPVNWTNRTLKNLMKDSEEIGSYYNSKEW